MTLVVYRNETWKMNKGDNKVINAFHSNCLRTILCIRWQDNVRKGKLLEMAKMKPLIAEVMSRRLKRIILSLR